MTQLDLFSRTRSTDRQVTDAELDTFKGLLRSHGWLTRAEIANLTGWDDRKVRSLAESMGSEVVKGQLGFKLTSTITRDDLPVATQASDAAVSQGKRMIRYGLTLRRRIHEIVG